MDKEVREEGEPGIRSGVQLGGRLPSKARSPDFPLSCLLKV